MDASAVTAVLWNALDGLPERQRAIVVLRDVEGLSSEEACDVTGYQTRQNQRILASALCGRRTPPDIGGRVEEGVDHALLAAIETWCANRPSNCSPTIWKGASLGGSGGGWRATFGHAPTAPNYLEQIRITIKLTGAIEPEELAPSAVHDLTELYKRWRGEP